MAVFEVSFLYIGDREWDGPRRMVYEVVDVTSQWEAEKVGRKLLTAQMPKYGGPDNWALYSVVEANT